MTTQTLVSELEHFVPVGPSKENLDFADLEILDLSRYEAGPEAQKALARQLHNAMSTQGFFVLVNHGLSEENITRMVDIGHTILTRTSPQEKEQLKADILGKGEYPGFKPRGHWKSGGGDRIENFNINRNMDLHEQPSTLLPFRQEVEDFVRKVHVDILYKVLVLLALALEINDTSFFVKLHDYEKHDESWFRWMEYYENDSSASDAESLWLGGHQDLSSLSLLFSQPMSTLQVRDCHDTAQWKFVKHVPGAIIVNAGEPLMWWTGNYLKAAVHRVIQPPADQRGHDRSSAFYFVVPNDDVVINTLLEESPLLQRAGIKKWFEDGEAPTSKEWVNSRVRMTGQKSLSDGESTQKSVREKVGNVTTTWYR